MKPRKRLVLPVFAVLLVILALCATNGQALDEGSEESLTVTPTVITASGVIESGVGGFRFPDGSLQQTAANQGGSANSGLYNNRIPDREFSSAFTEVCFGDGAVNADIHTVAESTAGGNCLPGDLGWIIERDERSAQTWEFAKAQCLLEGMRLPEPFELKYSCKNAAIFGLSDMTDDFEWSSNTATVNIRDAIAGGVIAPSMGEGNCSNGIGQAVATGVNGEAGSEASLPFRCVL